MPDFSQSEEEAARTLLRGRVSYDADCSNVAAFEEGCVSLPDDISGAPMLGEALPHAARKFLKDEFAPMLRSEAEILELADHGEPIKPYMDVVLQNNRGLYDLPEKLRKAVQIGALPLPACSCLGRSKRC